MEITVGLVAWLVLVALTIVVCIVVICAVRRPMRGLLEANSHIVPARSFYLRAFSVLVFLAALAAVSKTGTPDTDKAFMEYVWWIVGALEPTFSALSLGIISYATLLTILFVVLGRYRD